MRGRWPASIAPAAAWNGKVALLLKTIQAGVEAGEFKLVPGNRVERLAYQCWVTVHGMAMLLVTHFYQNEGEIEVINFEVLKAVIAELKST